VGTARTPARFSSSPPVENIRVVERASGTARLAARSSARRKRLPVGLEDQERLHEQRQIRDAVGVLVGLADRLGLRRSDDAADEEPGDVQALPRCQIVSHDDRSLGGEIADGMSTAVAGMRGAGRESG
jgi:hypothetical protein